MADEEVKVRLKDEKAEHFLAKKGNICYLCCKQISKYTCPRCNVPYCSLACYRSSKHLQCSESFYKNCIEESLTLQNRDSEEKRKMLDILRRLESNVDVEREDELQVTSLEERLANVDLEGHPDAVWSSLTEGEKKEFESSLASGAISQMLEGWKPWWISEANENHRLVVDEMEMGKSAERTKSNSSLLPQVLKNIPPLTSLLKTKPNINIKFNIINVLYGYAYVMRLYNGCLDVPDQASENLLRLSPVLLQNESYESEELVVVSCFEITRQNKDLFNSEVFSQSVLKDVISICDGSKSCGTNVHSFIDIALSEIHRLLERGRKILRHDKGKDKTEQELCKNLWCAKKKVYFLMAWSNEHSRVVKEMVPLLKALQTSIALDYKKHMDDKQTLECNWERIRPAEKRSLIVEL